MARNEEKQLARLNRYYLQQNKEEELRKRPPRPRLDSLTTLDDVKKWIPSIMKDIEFYVKQMEVPCYPKRIIEEFERRISQLRGEYKAFVKKAHDLEPELTATPWSDRPYNAKRQKKLAKVADTQLETKEGDSSIHDKDKSTSLDFCPISTPLLLQTSKCPLFYGERHSDQTSAQHNPNLIQHHEDSSQDQPLNFQFEQWQALNKANLNSEFKLQQISQMPSESATSGHEALNDRCKSKPGFSRDPADVKSLSNIDNPNNVGEAVSVSLNLPYSDSSSDDDDDDVT